MPARPCRARSFFGNLTPEREEIAAARRGAAPEASSTVTTCLSICHDPTCKYDGNRFQQQAFRSPCEPTIPPFDLLSASEPPKSFYSSLASARCDATRRAAAISASFDSAAGATVTGEFRNLSTARCRAETVRDARGHSKKI